MTDRHLGVGTDEGPVPSPVGAGAHPVRVPASVPVTVLVLAPAQALRLSAPPASGKTSQMSPEPPRLGIVPLSGAAPRPAELSPGCPRWPRSLSFAFLHALVPDTLLPWIPTPSSLLSFLTIPSDLCVPEHICWPSVPAACPRPALGTLEDLAVL